MPANHSAIPPRYIIRSYLRRQDADQKALRDNVRETLFDEWKDAYSRGKLREAAVDRLSSRFEHHLRQSGGFSVYKNIVLPTRAAPFRHRHSVSAFLGAPMTLGGIGGMAPRRHPASRR